MFSTLPRRYSAVKNRCYRSWNSTPLVRPGCTALRGRVYHYYRFNYYYSHLSIHELLVDLWRMLDNVNHISSIWGRSRKGGGCNLITLFSPSTLSAWWGARCMSVLFKYIYMWTESCKRSSKPSQRPLSSSFYFDPVPNVSKAFVLRSCSCNKSHFWRHGKGTHSGNTDAAVWCGTQKKRGEKKKASLGDRWVNREEGGVADGSQLRYEGSERVDDALYSRHRGDRLSRPAHRRAAHSWVPLLLLIVWNVIMLGCNGYFWLDVWQKAFSSFKFRRVVTIFFLHYWICTVERSISIFFLNDITW